MNASEPNLFDVRFLSGIIGIDQVFIRLDKRGRVLRQPAFEHLVFLLSPPLRIGCNTVLGKELDAALIQGQGMTEMADTSVFMNKRKKVGDDPHRSDRIPATRMGACSRSVNQLTPTCRTYQMPKKSTWTVRLKVFLNIWLNFKPSSSSRIYISNANGSCWWLQTGRSPT